MLQRLSIVVLNYHSKLMSFVYFAVGTYFYKLLVLVMPILPRDNGDKHVTLLNFTKYYLDTACLLWIFIFGKQSVIPASVM